MDKQELEQLVQLRKRKARVENLIDKFEQKVDWDWHYEYPNGRPVPKIEIGQTDCTMYLDTLRALDKAIDKRISTIELWIAQFDDDVALQNILSCKYCDGLKDKEIANIVGFERSVITRRINNFWKTQTNTQNTKKV
jgi:hypothetical protein